MLAIQVVVFVLGLLVVLRSILSAIRTFVVPRGAWDAISSFEFQVFWRLFRGLARPRLGYERRDAIMALFAPIALVVLPLVLLGLILAGFAAMYWAIEPTTIEAAARDSGSALLTLGFAPVQGWVALILSFLEAAIGLILVALLIAYLPTMYGAFQRREAFVAKLDVRAGRPASGTELLIRFWTTGSQDMVVAALVELWTEAETWFIDLDESNTTLAALPFYRSPGSGRSWITAAGAILDGAALLRSTVDVPAEARADLAITAGYTALDGIAGFFRLPTIGRPARAGDPIRVSRAEFDAAAQELAAHGLPVRIDRDQAWLDFAGWRVNYEDALLRLSSLVLAPEVRWNDTARRQAARGLAASS
ncbi:MAG: hypothetical protein ACRDGQ_03655 [Candidatus Limnocylindrales bacterium]